MKIAISTDGNEVSAHFGRCPLFTIVEVDGDKLAGKEVVENPGHHPGYLPEFLGGKGVECIIAGGMGMRAQGFFSESGIKAVLGISGSIDDVVSRILNGTLKGGESLCKPGEGKEKRYGIDRTDAVIEGKEYSGGREDRG